MTAASSIQVPPRFARAVLTAQPSDVEFLKEELPVHSAERLLGVTRTGYSPICIHGEPVPEVIRIVYVHEEQQGRSGWHVINSMKDNGISPYMAFGVASEEEARSAVLIAIKEVLFGAVGA